MSKTLIGRTILEQFRIDEFIASGGMGAVYRVWDLKRNVPLAMKILHADLADDPAIFKRFKREANALKKLAHPNIVPFYGLYQTADFAFLLERYVNGFSLKDILRQQQGKPMPVEDVLVYLKALSAALGYAHSNGVVHCDVKPGNVMVDQGGNIYLTDFGIARHSDSTTTTLATVGTAAYMAPEQIRGETVTPATDVYALGVMLFEMLTGKKMFSGDEKGNNKANESSGERIRRAHLLFTPPDPKTVNQALTDDISAVILNAVQKDAGQRYTSTDELFRAMCLAMHYPADSVPDRVNIPEAESDLSEDVNKETAPSRINHKHYSMIIVIVLLTLTTLVILFIALPNPLRNRITELYISPQKNTEVSTPQYTDVQTSITTRILPITDTIVPSTDTPVPTTVEGKRVDLGILTVGLEDVLGIMFSVEVIMNVGL